MSITARQNSGDSMSPVRTPYSEPKPGAANPRVVWLLSPFWLSALLLLVSHLSPTAQTVVQFMTQSPLR